MAATLALTLTLTLGTGAAGAQVPDPGPSPSSAVVEDLVVTGHPPGPALWRVRRGQAEVVVLGGLTPLPHQLRWSSPRLERALDGADQLLVPAEGRPRLIDVPGLAVHAAGLRQGWGHSLEPDLSEALRTRFQRQRMALGLGPGRYAHWKPAIAGFMLVADFRENAGLSSGKPATTVMRMAKARGVKVRPLADIHLAAMVKAAAGMTDAAHEACLGAALDDIEAEAAHSGAAAQAWAQGDLAGVRDHAPRSLLDQCLLQLPSAAALLNRDAAASVQTLNDALSRPGRTVAIIDLRLLLRANGVLDRLKAEGAEITVPQEAP